MSIISWFGSCYRRAFLGGGISLFNNKFAMFDWDRRCLSKCLFSAFQYFVNKFSQNILASRPFWKRNKPDFLAAQTALVDGYLLASGRFWAWVGPATQKNRTTNVTISVAILMPANRNCVCISKCNYLPLHGFPMQRLYNSIFGHCTIRETEV